MTLQQKKLRLSELEKLHPQGLELLRKMEKEMQTLTMEIKLEERRRTPFVIQKPVVFVGIE